MFITDQEGKTLVNTDHIISISTRQESDSVFQIIAVPAIRTANETIELGRFHDKELTSTVIEFLAFCIARGRNKVTQVPKEDEVRKAKTEAAEFAASIKMDAPFDELLEKIIKGKGEF